MIHGVRAHAGKLIDGWLLATNERLHVAMAGRGADRPTGLVGQLLRLLSPLARPWVAGLVALVVYVGRASLSPFGLGPSYAAYFNYLADAFLHGQLALRLTVPNRADLTYYADQVYLYWPPFPAVLAMPLVALFGVGVSDVLYTAVIAAGTVALLAQLLAVLDRRGVAPLTAERRAILVASCAFGSVLLILAPAGKVWYSAQVIGWGCVLLATLAALTRRGSDTYVLAGLALGCAMATRIGLVFNGVWLAYYLLRRDWQHPWSQRLMRVGLGVLPIVAVLWLLAWYNASRFGHPLETGLAWQNMSPPYRAAFERYGVFDLHYLPTNLYYQFVAYNVLTPDQWNGGGLFWMTPILLGAPYAIWRGRRIPLVWSLVLSCVLAYIPIGLLLGTGTLTFGPRYLLDLMVPIIVLTAIGIRRWRLDILLALMMLGCATYALGSLMWWLYIY